VVVHGGGGFVRGAELTSRGPEHPDGWDDRAYLRGSQYKTDANLAARQSIYAYQHPRIDLQARVLDLAAPAPSGTVVDVGCGNGRYLAELARRGFSGRAIGVDLSLGMLEAAREHLNATAGPAPPVTLVNADATALPLRDGAADLTLAAHMLYHVPDPAEALAELRRVTRKGGRVVIALNGTDHLRELRQALATALGAGQAIQGERVRLDNGEAMARAFFTHVTRHDFVSELRIPGPAPIADYLGSMPGTHQQADPAKLIEAVVSALPATPDGYHTTIAHTGCIIAEVD
jgi:ubiquinone/menaquinone biosynthesis C-methylase UbiE